MPRGVYRISTHTQSGFQASIRRTFSDSSYRNNPDLSRAAAVEWCQTVRETLGLPPSVSAHRASDRRAYVAGVTKWFQSEGAAVRWRRKAVKTIKDIEETREL